MKIKKFDFDLLIFFKLVFIKKWKQIVEYGKFDYFNNHQIIDMKNSVRKINGKFPADELFANF